MPVKKVPTDGAQHSSRSKKSDLEIRRNLPPTFDIHMLVHRNVTPNYSQQDKTFLGLFIYTDALHVSGGSSAHHQEHITVHTASGIVNQYRC